MSAARWGRRAGGLHRAANARRHMRSYIAVMTDLIVWHDGACPLCRREIALMRRLDTRGAIRFVDASDRWHPKSCPIDRRDLLARFHSSENGELHSGAAAFAAMWRAIPLLRPIGLLREVTMDPGVARARLSCLPARAARRSSGSRGRESRGMRPRPRSSRPRAGKRLGVSRVPRSPRRVLRASSSNITRTDRCRFARRDPHDRDQPSAKLLHPARRHRGRCAAPCGRQFVL